MEFEPFYFDVLKFRKELIETEKTDFLYHYTTASGLLGILSPKNKDRQLLFWFTDTRYLNDSMEYIGGLKIAKKYLLDSNYFNSQVVVNALESLNSFNGRICVLSLSSEGNSLSQWRAYSEDGGYSLKLNTKLFESPNHLAYRYLTKCIYCVDLLKYKVHQSIGWHVEQYQKASQGKQVPEQKYILSHCSEGLVNSIRVLASIYKHKSFAVESEWRHVFQFPNNQEIQLRTRSGLLIPYVPITFSPESLEDITVAPGSREELAKSAAEDLLELHSIEYKDKVMLSGSPFYWD